MTFAMQLLLSTAIIILFIYLAKATRAKANTQVERYFAGDLIVIFILSKQLATSLVWVRKFAFHNVHLIVIIVTLVHKSESHPLTRHVKTWTFKITARRSTGQWLVKIMNKLGNPEAGFVY